jgi:hypothetical protein
MNRSSILNLGTFPFHCVVVVGSKEYAQTVLDDQASVYKNNQFDWEMEHNGARTFCLPCGDSLVWMKKYNIPLLVHELFHVTKHALNQVDTPLNDTTEEVYAYTLQHLTQQATTKLKQKKEKSNG